MDTTKLIKFFGYTSIYEPLDEFLIQNKVKKRPKSYETKDVIEKSFGLGFEDYVTFADDFLIKQRNEGNYVFTDVEFDVDFPHQLPFDLKFNMNESEFCKTLGSKLVALDPEVEKRNANSLRFFYKNLFIVAKMNKEKTASMWISFSLPNKFDYKHYGLK